MYNYFMSSQYIPRPIAQAILRSKRKVVVLEGARAVGKTMMSKTQLLAQGYAYETLAEPNTYELARTDLNGWLSGLELPVIIDEAQRIRELPLAIKELADGMVPGKPHFVLTGSSVINRSGLDGQDPLARRAERFTMNPLTRREMNLTSTSIIDDLWRREPDTGFEGAVARGELFEMMAAGGFPEYSAQYADYEDWEREKLVADDISIVLGNTISPDEKLDISTALNVLGHLLCVPGGISNASALGNAAGLDRRTVDRYIGIFMRRFLIHMLPNLRTAPNRQSSSRSKLHPIDTSLSVETLLGKGGDPEGNPVTFGMLFESFVVNQIVPAAQWSTIHPDCFYWRESGAHPKEVDLVMLRRNRLVGVEVKSSSTVKREDFAGLSQLAKDRRFFRGYLVYTGSRVLKYPNGLWALPVSALWEPGAFV